MRCGRSEVISTKSSPLTLRAFVRTALIPFGMALVLALSGATATIAQTAPSVFVTLGTMAGAIPSATRSQPANLLLTGDQAILIDAGDGAAEQLAKAGVPLTRIRTVFLSHMHFDHIGGLFAVLGLRFQINSPGKVTIYGPPGTKRLVDGLVAAMQPFAEAGAGIPGQPLRLPESSVDVVEITGGQTVKVGNVSVTAATNTHYSYPAGSADAERFQSLSFRFDLPDRSIVYTGDTGPSSNVERLARGADLLVSEVIDPEAAAATVLQLTPNLPPPALATLKQHMAEQHLTPDQVGILAHAAGVKKVVLTHNGLSADGAERAKALIATKYSGTVVAAHDLDRF